MSGTRGDKLRLGIVGCGDIAGYTAWFARLNRKVQLSACCDVNAEHARRFAQRHHILDSYSDYEELLNQAPLDAVYLAVPHHLHAGMITAAIERRLPVWVEKPVTRTLAEGREVVRLAAQHNGKVGVNYQYRYDRGCYALARAVQSGELGAIHSARINIPWSRQADYFKRSPWHAQLAKAGGGTLITQGSHMLDVVLWALGAKPCSAMGYMAQRRFQQVEVEDLAVGVLELESGALIEISSSMVAAQEGALRVEVYGEQATAVYSDRPLPHVRFHGRRIRQQRPPVWGLHALQRSLEGFRRWVVDDQPYLVPARETLPVLAAIEAIYHSAHSGRRETVNAFSTEE